VVLFKIIIYNNNYNFSKGTSKFPAFGDRIIIEFTLTLSTSFNQHPSLTQQI